MAGITANTSFKLDGKTTVNVGDWGHFEWGPSTPRAWMGPVDISPAGPVDPGIKVNVTLAGANWDMHTLRFNGGAQFDVKIRDNSKLGSEPVWIDRIGLSHGSSDVVLTNASVRFINGGRGDDKITTGNSYVGYIDLNRGDNFARTGKGYVDAITAREGNDQVTTGNGDVGFIDLGHGNNSFATGKGWVDALVARSGDDVATIGAGGAGSVNLGHGDNTVTTGKGWVDSIVTRDGDDLIKVGSGGVGFIATGSGNDRVVVSRLDNKDWLVTAQGGQGADTVDFSALSRGIDWSSDAAYAETRDGNFLMMSFENVIGTKKADKLGGSDADNDIDGGKGKDKITGGEGADNLTGGAGKDTFIFLDAADSTVGGKGRDLIGDFSQKQKDKIDLRAIDAVPGGKDDKFKFIGEVDFSGAKGELRVEREDGETFVYGDIDGDGEADFAIDLAGEINLKAGDFLL